MELRCQARKNLLRSLKWDHGKAPYAMRLGFLLDSDSPTLLGSF